MILFPDLPDLLIEQVDVANEITLTLRTTSETASCPTCGTGSTRVQSRYRRTLHDLPSAGRPVHLIVHLRRFFCKKHTCAQKIFVERLPELCRPHAQRTTRLQEALCQLGLRVGGQAGADVGSELGISGSRDTILRLVRRSQQTPTSEPRIVGLDDWARRRRLRYGTLICDLERSQPIALLPDRSVETVSAWLKKHPSIDIVSRHGSSETARFLNYEIHTLQEDAHRDHRDRRSLNGTIGLRVPREVIKNKCQSYKRHSRRVQHRTELINDSDFTIVALYQAEYRGLVEYYRLAYNLHSLTELEGTMEMSLTKTLAAKYKMSVPKVYKKYQATFQEGKRRDKVLQVLIERENKKPLVARWGGISLHWDIQAPIKDSRMFLGPGRSELEKRLLADTCEYCGTTGDKERIEVHHIRALKDLATYDGREKPAWVKIMAARKRKTLVLCASCHQDVTYGRSMRRKPVSVSWKR